VLALEESKTTGRCLCGDVRYEIEGKVSPIWLCHCSKCRRASGSAFNASAVCSPDAFRWLAGEDSVTLYEDTPGFKVRFCTRCGSPVPSFLEQFGLVFIHVGSLDGDPGRRIGHHIFVGSKAPWYEICDDHPQFAEHKPGQG
jgi:hypothetical protein